jgi:hypothetical protein
MVEPRRHRRFSVAVAALVLVVLGAIALEGVPSAKVLDGDDPCEGAVAAPPAQIKLMPAGLSFDQIGTVTRVRKDKGHVMVQAVTSKSIDEVTVLIQDAVTAAGYHPAGMDNEGFEAEVFFTTESYAAGQALVRQSGCEGRWDISLVLIHRDARAIAGSAANATCGPPRLTILSPAPGETVRPPPEIRFRIRCFRVGPAPYGHLHAWTGPPGASSRFELRPHRQAGTIVLPDPLLSGRQTLTFQLARANHAAVRNRAARVVVRDVIFESS